MEFQGRGLAVEAGDRRLIADLDFDLDAGRTLVVRGPSGVGKTQLLRFLACLTPAGRGELRLAGRTPEEVGPQAWRADVCLVVQGAPVLAGCPLDWVHAVEALAVQRGRPHEDPRGLAEGWGLPASAFEQPWAELSVGERQRCQLAVALARRPRVLLLDEPTSALDPDAARAFEATMAERTAVWVTHSPEQAARVADDVLELAR